MITFANTQLWVHDQDEALAFYTEKLGMEVRADATMTEMDGFRWLMVGPVGQPYIGIVLMAIPGQPIMDEELDEELTARGVEFVEKPENRPYGVDSSFRDPSGNHIRLTQAFSAT